jgi:hypothetical protein
VLRKIDTFLAAWDTYSDDNSTGKRLAKDETRDATKAAMRDFANTSIRFNKRMTDEQKLYYGVRPADKTNTAGEPETFPEVEANTSVIRQHPADHDSLLGQRDEEASEAPRHTRRGDMLGRAGPPARLGEGTREPGFRYREPLHAEV